jgi:hypothetical protein
MLEYEEALGNDRLFYFPDAGHTIYLTRSEDMAGLLHAFLRGDKLPMQPYQDARNPRPDIFGSSLESIFDD